MKDNIIQFNNEKKEENKLLEEMTKAVTDMLKIPFTQMSHKIENKELKEITLDFIKSAENAEKMLKNIDQYDAEEKDKKTFISIVGLYHMSLGTYVQALMQKDLEKRGGVN